jgi:four helix bundle suffix protein
LIARRCKTAHDVVLWVHEQHQSGRGGLSGQEAGRHQNGRGGLSGRNAGRTSTGSMGSTYAEIAANAALALINVACALLDRQVASQAAAFEAEGGFTERLYRARSRKRRA